MSEDKDKDLPYMTTSDACVYRGPTQAIAVQQSETHNPLQMLYGEALARQQNQLQFPIGGQPAMQIYAYTPTQRRFVQVIVIDPCPSVPLDKSIVYKGEPHMTESTDTELFYEIGLPKLLHDHNAMRLKLPDKSVKDRVQTLEAARIRDLRMHVRVLASF